MPGHLTDLIVDYIVQNATNVTELFHAWDKNHDGLIDKVEFRTFLNGVGFIVPREASDAMFDTFDDDGSGGLDYSELVRKSRKLAFERGKNMKDKPKTGNPSLSRFNEKWTEKNIAHQKAFAKSVQKRNLQQAARAEAEVAVRRVAQLEARRERRDEARIRGTEAKEPYRLRQMKDDRCAASASPNPPSAARPTFVWRRTRFSPPLQVGRAHGATVGGGVGARRVLYRQEAQRARALVRAQPVDAPLPN